MPGERPRPLEQGVEGGGERVDVRQRRRRRALQHLGRGVVDGEPAAAGDRALVVERRDAEVTEGRLAELRDEEVVGLDVAMQQPAVVGRLEGAGDLHPDVEHHRDGQLTLALSAFAVRPPAVQLHDDARLLRRREGGVEHRDDVGVLGDQAHRPTLPLEAAALPLVGESEAEDLQRDTTVEVALAGAEHVAEPPRPIGWSASKPSIWTVGTEGSGRRGKVRWGRSDRVGAGVSG